MGFFGSLFGPSMAERVKGFMQESRLSIEDRIRLCILTLLPAASDEEIARGIPVVEIKKHLTGLKNSDELINLATAMFMRKGMRLPVIVSKSKEERNWTITGIDDAPTLPANDELRYRRYEDARNIIWTPINNYGEDIVSSPR